MSKKATESALAELHGTLARKLTETLDSEELAPAAYFAVAVGFLKNNGITADPNQNAELAALGETLKQKRKDRKALLADMHAAAEEYGGLIQ